MSFEQEHIPKDTVIDQTIVTDPELLAIQSELNDTVTEIHGQIDDFAISLDMANPVDKLSITQNTVNSWVEDILGEAPNSEFTEASRYLPELTRGTKIHYKSNGFKEFIVIPLADGLNCLTLTDGGKSFQDDFENSRSFRKSVGHHVGIAKNLMEYWQSSNISNIEPLLTSEAIADLKNKLLTCAPTLPNKFNLDSKLSKEEEIRSFREYCAESIVSNSGIEKNIDLSEVKLVVINDLLSEFSKPCFANILSKFHKYSNNPPLTMLGYYVDTLHQTDSSSTVELHQELLLEDKENRLFKKPSRKFTKVLDRIWELAELYKTIITAEDVIQDEPIISNKLKDIYENATMEESAYISSSVCNKIFSNHKELLAWCNQQTTDRFSEVKEQVLFIDSQRSEAASQIKKSIMLLPLPRALNHEVVGDLDYITKNFIAKAIDKWEIGFQLDQLQPEIESRISRIAEIDAQYELSNSKMRQRNPEIMTLAKILSDSVNNHDPLTVESSRRLVALLEGLYIERTGQDANMEEIVDCYLQDADELKKLILELEFLGSDNKSSKFLESINLLDELIDAGIFDNKNPGLAKFDEFILTYLMAKYPPVETTDVRTINPEENSELDETILPIETINQADFENIKVFPPGASESEIIDDFATRIEENDLPNIEWERIKRLIELRDKFVDQKLDVNFMRTQHASWQVLPFFILEAKLPDTTKSVVIVESPVYGNATYVYREAENRPKWRDVVQLSRREARAFGATAMVHVDSKKLNKHFTKVWNKVISELTIHQ
jgi:hypothetical protein